MVKNAFLLVLLHCACLAHAMLQERSSNIPGMSSLLHRIEKGDRPTCRGLNYEIAVADSLIGQGHTVKVGDVAQAEGFDIVTETLCVECKNINMPPNAVLGPLHDKLLEQQKKAAEQNKQFLVYFKRRIVKRLEEWLKNKKISYVRYTC